MLYAIYTAIKQHLTTADTDAVIKAIEWYNVQYESTIVSTPRVFIEFPEPLKFDQLSKDARRTPVKVRLHVVSQAVTGQDGQISDDIVEDHEAVATMVYNAIEGFRLETQGLASLHLSAWQHWHRYKGWLVTFVEFEGKKQI